MRRDEDSRSIGGSHEVGVIVVRILDPPCLSLSVRLLDTLASIDQLFSLEGLLVLLRLLNNVGVELLGRQLVVVVNPDCLILVLRGSAAGLAEAGTL
jgi:hypothetical protein